MYNMLQFTSNCFLQQLKNGTCNYIACKLGCGIVELRKALQITASEDINQSTAVELDKFQDCDCPSIRHLNKPHKVSVQVLECLLQDFDKKKG